MDITKGGPGSGEHEGHPFRGNGRTGAVRDHPKLGVSRGWKTTEKLYSDSAKANTDAAKAHEAIAKGHLSAGRKDEAVKELRLAQQYHMKAQGAHQGIRRLHETESENGTKGASLDTAEDARDNARDSRENAARVGKMADDLEGISSAAA